MNHRNEEFRILLDALESTPKALETTVERALERKKTTQKKRRILGIPAGSFAACFLGFMLLVNLFPPFARACGSVPLLRELAKAVAWSPSLSAAVENDYVQPIGVSQTKNGITATIEYLIVDQKQVNIFYTLEGDYEDLSGRKVEFFPDQHCAVSYGGAPNPPGTIQDITMDYVDDDVPDGFSMTIGVSSMDSMGDEAPTQSVKEDMLNPPEEKETEYLAEFTFNLKFDPNFTATGESIPVNQSVELNGETITVTEVQVYPTHVRINVTDHEENTAWLKGLEFYLENEWGQKFEPISNGISATGGTSNPGYVSFRLESAYFARSRHLTLHITGAEWLDKKRETVRFDLSEKTADFLPEGVAFKGAEKRSGGWLLEFSVAERKENHMHQVFYTTFLDRAGNKYEMGAQSSYTDYEDETYKRFIEELPLPGYYEDEVWLQPTYTHTTIEKTPITIPIK